MMFKEVSSGRIVVGSVVWRVFVLSRFSGCCNWYLLLVCFLIVILVDLSF